MQQKIVIRKKAIINRKKNYFEISSNFFDPLIQLLKKQKRVLGKTKQAKTNKTAFYFNYKAQNNGFLCS